MSSADETAAIFNAGIKTNKLANDGRTTQTDVVKKKRTREEIL
jgi:hypothetical protein